MSKRDIGFDTMERAVVALIEHRSLKKAAAAVGVHPVTLWRWLKMPHFREQLREAQNQIYSRELARLQLMAPKAVAVLEKMLHATGTPAGTRFRIAEYVLEQSKKPFAIEEIRLEGPEESLTGGSLSGIDTSDSMVDDLKVREQAEDPGSTQ